MRDLKPEYACERQRRLTTPGVVTDRGDGQRKLLRLEGRPALGAPADAKRQHGPKPGDILDHQLVAAPIRGLLTMIFPPPTAPLATVSSAFRVRRQRHPSS